MISKKIFASLVVMLLAAMIFGYTWYQANLDKIGDPQMILGDMLLFLVTCVSVIVAIFGYCFYLVITHQRKRADKRLSHYRDLRLLVQQLDYIHYRYSVNYPDIDIRVTDSIVRDINGLVEGLVKHDL